MSRSQMLDMICMMLGGHAAEEVILGEVYTGSSSDLKRATEFCRRMVTQYGMSDTLGTIYLGSDQEVFVGMEFGQSREYSENVAAQIDAEVKKMLDACYDKAKAIIAEHRDELMSLVDTLKREMTVSRAEFLALMNGEPLPEEKPVTIEATIEALEDTAQDAMNKIGEDAADAFCKDKEPEKADDEG